MSGGLMLGCAGHWGEGGANKAEVDKWGWAGATYFFLTSSQPPFKDPSLPPVRPPACPCSQPTVHTPHTLLQPFHRRSICGANGWETPHTLISAPCRHFSTG